MAKSFPKTFPDQYKIFFQNWAINMNWLWLSNIKEKFYGKYMENSTFKFGAKLRDTLMHVPLIFISKFCFSEKSHSIFSFNASSPLLSRSDNILLTHVHFICFDNNERYYDSRSDIHLFGLQSHHQQRIKMRLLSNPASFPQWLAGLV